METELWGMIVYIAFLLGLALGVAFGIVIHRSIKRMEADE